MEPLKRNSEEITQHMNFLELFGKQKKVRTGDQFHFSYSLRFLPNFQLHSAVPCSGVHRNRTFFLPNFETKGACEINNFLFCLTKQLTNQLTATLLLHKQSCDKNLKLNNQKASLSNRTALDAGQRSCVLSIVQAQRGSY